MQECRGPLGERLKRVAWPRPVEGELTIQLGRDNFVAQLDHRRADDRKHQVLYPLFDVRVQTLDDGILVIGYRVNPEGGVARECRQAWFCVPIPAVRA